MPAWDPSLPPFLIADYNVSDELPVIVTPMQSGPPRRTRFSGHYLSTGTLTMVATKAQVDSYQQLLAASNSGSDWITDMPLDAGAGVALNRIRVRSTKTAIMKQDDPTHQIGRWKITVGFETDEHNAS